MTGYCKTCKTSIAMEFREECSFCDRLTQQARGAFLELAMIGTAIAWGNLVVSSWNVSGYLPHPDDAPFAAKDLRRWHRARQP